MALKHSNFTVHKCSLIGIQLCTICLHIACDCFCSVAQLNGDGSTKWPTKPKMFTVWPFTEVPQSLVWKNGPHIHNSVLSGTWEETGADGEGERALVPLFREFIYWFYTLIIKGNVYVLYTSFKYAYICALINTEV